MIVKIKTFSGETFYLPEEDYLNELMYSDLEEREFNKKQKAVGYGLRTIGNKLGLLGEKEQTQYVRDTAAKNARSIRRKAAKLEKKTSAQVVGEYGGATMGDTKKEIMQSLDPLTDVHEVNVATRVKRPNGKPSKKMWKGMDGSYVAREHTPGELERMTKELPDTAAGLEALNKMSKNRKFRNYVDANLDHINETSEGKKLIGKLKKKAGVG